MAIQIQLRHGTAAAWIAANPLLAEGEVGLETDTSKFKIGTGLLNWNALPYAGGGTAVSAAPPSMPLPRDGAPGKDSFIPGPSGVPGAQGAQGIQGIQGIQGVPGGAGAAGTQGPPGFDGKRGVDGFPIPGPKGDPGAPGVAGTAGLRGPPGMDAKPPREPLIIPGPAGAAGAPGAPGINGLQGPMGPPGVDLRIVYREPLMIPGPPGLQGPQGNAGAPGAGGGGAPSMLMALDGKPGPPGFAIPIVPDGIKISALTLAADLTGPEVFAAVQGGASVRVTARQVAKYVGDAIQNQSFTSQSPAANATTYLAGSALAIPTGERAKVGSWCRWKATVKKTAAGIAAKSFAIKVGLAGTIADTTQVTLALPIGTAVVDEGDIEVFAGFTTVGAAAVLEAVIKVNHRLVTTGLINVQESVVRAVSAGFNSNVDLLIIGLAFVAGLAEAWTFDVMMSEAKNL
jgi:hypothetical protein